MAVWKTGLAKKGQFSKVLSVNILGFGVLLFFFPFLKTAVQNTECLPSVHDWFCAGSVLSTSSLYYES